MENLSINDHAAPPRPPSTGPGNSSSNALGAAAAPASQGPPQLPPQMFTTAAQLLDLTDKKLLLVLRDGRKLIGVLRSWDQFANLVLTSTTERYFVTSPNSTSPSPSSPESTSVNLFADIPRGTYLVRGENVLLLGEIDLDRDDDVPAGFVEGEIQDVFRLKKEEEVRRKERDKVRGRMFAGEWGGEMENSGEVLF